MLVIARGLYLGIGYPCLDELTSKGATEEQRTPDNKKPGLLDRAKCLFQLVAGARFELATFGL